MLPKYEPSSGYLGVNLHSLLLFTSPSPPLPSTSIVRNASVCQEADYRSVRVYVCGCASAPVALQRFSTGCRHPNRNLIWRRVKLFLNYRLHDTCLTGI